MASASPVTYTIKMIKAVIIDVDDTLCLTEAACFKLENDTLKQMNRPPMSREVHISTWGQPLNEAIKERSPGVDVAIFEKLFETTMEEYVAAGKLDQIPNQNYAALDILIEQGRDIMLLTSRTHSELKHMLAPDHLLASRVTAFYYKDNTRFHKPDPRVFDELFEAHSLEPNQCVYIGDSPSDAAAAKQAGLHFIASLESGIREKEEFSAFGADGFVNAFSEIVEAIGTLETS